MISLNVRGEFFLCRLLYCFYGLFNVYFSLQHINNAIINFLYRYSVISVCKYCSVNVYISYLRNYIVNMRICRNSIIYTILFLGNSSVLHLLWNCDYISLSNFFLSSLFCLLTGRAQCLNKAKLTEAAT